MLVDCVKYCYFPNVVVLLPITVSSLSPSFLALGSICIGPLLAPMFYLVFLDL